MRHFEAGQWADFTRDSPSGEEVRTSMSQHLDSGCRECGAAMQAWQAVRENGRNERDYTPSPELVLQVKAMSAMLNPSSAWGVLPQLAQLIYDSVRQPVTAGVRGATANARQLLYRVGGIAIDLRLEVNPGEHPVFLFGQVLQEGQTDRCEEFVEVSLMLGSRTLARTNTNELGEFEMHVPASPGLALSIKQRGGRHVLVPLSAVAGAGWLSHRDKD